MPRPAKPSFETCTPAQQALFDCKQKLGLLPRQCYRPEHHGACDAEEFEFKKCLAFAADPKSALLLYNTSTPRDQRVAANARIQKKLRAFNEPCVD